MEGGSNGTRYYIFKQDLQALVNELGIEFALPIIRPTPSSTIRSSIASFLRSRAGAKGDIRAYPNPTGVDGNCVHSRWTLRCLRLFSIRFTK